MNTKNYAVLLGLFVGVLGLLGLVMGEGRAAGIMNIDLMLDIGRLILGVFLIFGGLHSKEMAQRSLMIFGIVYIALFLLGLNSQNLYGLLPHGLGPLDQMLNFVGGLLGIALGVRLPAMINARRA